MIFDRLALKDVEKLKPLLNDYKKAIHEEELTECQFTNLNNALENEKIIFYIAKVDDEIVAMCSITTAFSTYKCEDMGIFEDFFIKPSYRGKGIASKLVQFVTTEMKKMNVTSVWVGCADVHVELYKHLGFNIPLGNLLTWNDS